MIESPGVKYLIGAGVTVMNNWLFPRGDLGLFKLSNGIVQFNMVRTCNHGPFPLFWMARHVWLALIGGSLIWSNSFGVGALDESFCDQFIYSPTVAPTGAPPTFRPTQSPSVAKSHPSARPTAVPTPIPTIQPSALPTVVPTGSPYSYCAPYVGNGTYSGSICTFYTRTSGYVTLSACATNGGTCDIRGSDTYFTLYDSEYNIVTTNDDTCGWCSAITFRPASSSCSVYYLYQYCYPDVLQPICSATTAITNGYVLTNPTYSPSVPPTPGPTVEPTASATPPTSAPTEFNVTAEFLTQLSVLYDLYEALDGDGWRRKQGWDTIPGILAGNVTFNGTNDIYGVEFEGQNVISISLVFNFLAGSIPDSIQYLTALQYIAFDYNDLSGTLPSSLSTLTNLVSIAFAYTYLEGTIPHDLLDNLASLTTLNLYGNLFTGTIPWPQSRSIESLNLTTFAAFDNLLTGKISTAYCNLTMIETLLLGGNQLECYSVCSPASDALYDFIMGGFYPTCRNYQDEAMCALETALAINDHIPAVAHTPVAVSVVDRWMTAPVHSSDNVIHTDTFEYLYDVSRFELSFERNILLGSLRKLDGSAFYYHLLVKIGVSSNGIDFTEVFYCGYCEPGVEYNATEGTDGEVLRYVAVSNKYPGLNGEPTFVSAEPYLTVTVYTISDGIYKQLRVAGFYFKQTEV
jgi:hypothetical protein